MRIAVFGSHPFEKSAFEDANRGGLHSLSFLEPRLTAQTARLAEGCGAACSFVSDRVDEEALKRLNEAGVRVLLLRCAGFNHVDLAAAHRIGMPVLRVPAYSPSAVAEHTFALLLALVRKLPKAHARVREGNFSLDGLVGFNLSGKVLGIVGTGKIGLASARIAAGFGCRVLANDVNPDQREAADIGFRYVALEELLRESDIVSLHLPLTESSRHLISRGTLEKMKPGTILINTARGGLIDTRALIDALKSERLGGVALDVYEGESEVFFRDLSGHVIQDDVLMRLLTFPNVLITAHQAFLTREALQNIAETTLENATAFEENRELKNRVDSPAEAGPPKP